MKTKNVNMTTLLDKSVARKGYRFIFRKNKACYACKYKNICLDKLHEDRVYEVLSVKKPREKIICPITGNEVYFVRVKLTEITTAISSEKAIDGIVTLWREPSCENYKCNYRDVCFPSGLLDGDKIRVVKVLGRIQCPLHHNLTLVSVVPII